MVTSVWLFVEKKWGVNIRLVVCREEISCSCELQPLSRRERFLHEGILGILFTDFQPCLLFQRLVFCFDFYSTLLCLTFLNTASFGGLNVSREEISCSCERWPLSRRERFLHEGILGIISMGFQPYFVITYNCFVFLFQCFSFCVLRFSLLCHNILNNTVGKLWLKYIVDCILV